jgi:CubicO group peptidase (beta-lactamase class C family)
LRRYKNALSLAPLVIILHILCGCHSSLPELDITKEKVAAIEKLMDRFYDNDQYFGTILVTVNGDILFQRATGYANRDSLIPNTLDTRFRIASTTKQFTAMLVLQLVEEGMLNLDDKLTDIIKEYPESKGKGITVGHLLTHRSGIVGEPKVPDLEKIEKLYHSQEQMLKLITSFDLASKPGSRYEYSNFGYYLLGLIIERVSGKSYAELLQEKICEPLGMTNTLPEVTGANIPQMARGYHFDYINGYQDASHLDMSFVFGYGHLVSTLHDLYLWDRALYGEKLLSSELKNKFFDKYGWLYQRVAVGNEGKTVRVNLICASVNGFKANVLRHSDDEVLIVQLTNHKEHNGHIVQAWGNVDITSRILAILYDQPYALPKRSAAYEVFRVLLDSGATAAREKYADLNDNKQDEFWFIEEEFEILANGLLDAGMLDKALVYCGLAPDNAEIRELITKIQARSSK